MTFIYENIDATLKAYGYAYVQESVVSSINITNARKDLYKIVESVNETHEPIYITGKNSSAILIGEEDWRSIQETLYLTSIPGMRESIKKGMDTKVEDLSDDLDW